MKVLFLQISDIHCPEALPSNVGERFSRIGDLLPAHFVDPIDAIIFIYPGDFAYSGREEEYEEVYSRIQEAEDSVKSAFGKSIDYFSIGVPGNHDCDFSGDQDARESLLRAIIDGEKVKFKGTFANVLLEPQLAYAEFIEVVCSDTPQRLELMSGVDTRIAWYHSISVGAEKLNILCYNTAWLSKIRERKGTLVLPTNKLNKVERASFQISILHHPVQWLETINSLDFRQMLYESSDIVFTGHEHSKNTFRGDLEGAGNASFHEAPAFIPETAAEEAGFSALYVDTSTKKEVKVSFLWQDDVFAPYIGKQRADPEQAILPLVLEVNRFRRNREWEFTNVISEFLDNPEIELHRNGAGKITLPQVFVCADMREMSARSKYEKGRTIPGDTAISEIMGKPAVIVVGSDQSGKTSLSKMTMQRLRSEGYLPLWANGVKVPANPTAFKPFISKLVREQYGENNVDDFLAAPAIEKVLIVDDYHHCHPNLRKNQGIFDIAGRFFGRIFAFSHDTEMTPFELGRLALRSEPQVSVFTLGPLTYKRRLVLIDKWLRISPDFGKDIQKDQRDEMVLHQMVNATVDDYMQPYPPYVLAVLQSVESGREVDLSTSTHGHLYEVFIKAALAKRASMTNYQIISAFLATLAIECFEKERSHFDDDFLDHAQKRFVQETDLDRDAASLKTDLFEYRFLSKSESGYHFRENYIYYYFVAFYIKDRLHQEPVKQIVRECASRAWVQDYANILLFLAHLSKDSFIVETILAVSKSTFVDIGEATLEGELSFLSEPLPEKIELEEEVETSQETRESALQSAAEETALSHTPYAFRRDSTLAEIGLVGELSAALKTLQVLGQLLKNFPANFDPQKKVEIVDECIGLGMRTLGKYYKFAEDGSEEIIREFALLVRAKLPGIDDIEAKRRASIAIANFCQMAGFGIVKRTSLAIGSRVLSNTYLKVFGNQLSPARKLVHISLQLDHSGHFPEDAILGANNDLSKNPFARRILQSLVIRHFRLFHLSFATRQRVGSKLDISYKNTLALGSKDKWLL